MVVRWLEGVRMISLEEKINRVLVDGEYIATDRNDVLKIIKEAKKKGHFFASRRLNQSQYQVYLAR